MILIKEQNVSEWALLKSSSSETSTSRMFMVAFNELGIMQALDLKKVHL